MADMGELPPRLPSLSRLALEGLAHTHSVVGDVLAHDEDLPVTTPTAPGQVKGSTQNDARQGPPMRRSSSFGSEGLVAERALRQAARMAAAEALAGSPFGHLADPFEGAHGMPSRPPHVRIRRVLGGEGGGFGGGARRMQSKTAPLPARHEPRSPPNGAGGGQAVRVQEEGVRIVGRAQRGDRGRAHLRPGRGHVLGGRGRLWGGGGRR